MRQEKIQKGENGSMEAKRRAHFKKSMLGGSWGTMAISSWESLKTMSAFNGMKTALQTTHVRSTEMPQELEGAREPLSQGGLICLFCYTVLLLNPPNLK